MMDDSDLCAENNYLSIAWRAILHIIFIATFLRKCDPTEREFFRNNNKNTKKNKKKTRRKYLSQREYQIKLVRKLIILEILPVRPKYCCM